MIKNTTIVCFVFIVTQLTEKIYPQLQNHVKRLPFLTNIPE